MRLFLNPQRRAYLRELSDEFGLSPSQVKDELQNLNQAGLLNSAKDGRQIMYGANSDHPLFPELHSMVRKALGMDRILESIVERLGRLDRAILLDDYAEGKDSGIIDLVLIGHVDQNSLRDLVEKTERYIERKIRTLVLTEDEYQRLRPSLQPRPQLLLWTNGAYEAASDPVPQTPTLPANSKPSRGRGSREAGG